MKKRAWALSLCLVGALIIGIAGAVTYSNFTFHQKTVSRLESDLSAFAGILAKAQMDMKQSTSNPTTPLEKAYEVNVKVDVGQLNVLWANMSPELVTQGLPDKDVQQIGEGLTIIDTNILPPRVLVVEAPTVQRARSWITFFYNSMDPNNTMPKSSTVYLSRLESKISVIAAKYRSYKSDSNFQVQ